MVNLEIINEDDGTSKNLSFPSSGTFYELASAIQDIGMSLPETFFLITNSQKLNTNESYTFADGQKVKIRDAQSLECFGANFTDLTVGKIKLIKTSNKAPKWRCVTKGINLFGICKNDKCEAYKKEVIHMIKEKEFSLTENNGLMKCPICNQNIISKTVGFYNCYYNYFGIKYDEDKDETTKFGVKINDFDKSFVNDDNTVIVNGKKITVGKTPKNVTNYFDEKENGNIQFIELTFQVKKF